MESRRTRIALLAIAAVGAAGVGAFADEGMWPFSNPPLAKLKEIHGFAPAPEWFDHLRLASVRIKARRWPGDHAAAGSFVGSNGLVLTCRHVVTGILLWNRSLQEDHARDGFVASDGKSEFPCPDIEIEVLTSMEEVTTEVNGPLAAGGSPLHSREAVIDAILRRQKTSARQRCEVVSLHGDVEHWLYRYEKYDDVRLVFLPEAFASADAHVSTKRRVLDAALLRVYRDGKPIVPEHRLRTNTRGSGDFVVAYGNPGCTSRLRSIPEVNFMRTIGIPLRLRLVDALISACAGLECSAPETNGLVADYEADLETERFMASKELEGLERALRIGRLQTRDAMIREGVGSDDAKRSEYDRAIKILAGGFAAYSTYAERDFWCQVIEDSIACARWPMFRLDEPLTGLRDRLYSLRSSALDFTYFTLLRPTAHRPVAEALLGSVLEQAREALGSEDPLMVAVLDGRSAEELAKAICAGASVDQLLLLMGKRASDLKSVGLKDPFSELAARIAPIHEELHERATADLGSHFDRVNANVASSYFAAFGGNGLPPDANGTPRFSYGTVCGSSSFNSFLRRAESDGATIPARWRGGVDEREGAVTHSFITTCDAVGGNSGGPVVDREGKLLGIMTNSSLSEDVYDSSSSRSTALSVESILLVLRRVYGADSLADEITGW